MLSYTDFWAKLSEAYPLTKGELRLPINSELTELTGYNVELLLNDLKKIIEELINSVRSRDYKELAQKHGDEDIIPLFEHDFSGIIRMDCVVNTEGKIKILEVNADYPDGLLMHDHTYSLLLGEKTRRHVGALEKLLNSENTIFVLYPEEAFFKDAYYAEYQTLRDLGYQCYIGTPKDLEVKDGKIYSKGVRIDCIRRCMESRKFEAGFIQLLANAEVHYINSFDIRVIGYKSVLEEVKSDYIPRTFTLSLTNHETVIANKDEYVIKPANLFEGRGVYIGKDESQEDWERAVRANLNSHYVAQEYVEVRKMSARMYDAGEIKEGDYYFDICPHFFVKNGKVIHDGLILTRFSKSKIMNVAQGGGIGYLRLSNV